MLGENVKRLRQEKQLSRDKLGKEINITARCIEYIESRKNKNPTLNTLKKLSDFFEISIDELLNCETHKK